MINKEVSLLAYDTKWSNKTKQNQPNQTKILSQITGPRLDDKIETINRKEASSRKIIVKSNPITLLLPGSTKLERATRT